jgi:dTDP-4-dehydrorhamnose reductase
MKILILGHNGLLGNTVFKYLRQNFDIEITDNRWGTKEFEDFIKSSNSEWLINCIGCIPQKTSTIKDYYYVNTELPIYLTKFFKGKIINPSTDCEFSGKINIDHFYKKTDYPDAIDDYGISKKISYMYLESLKNPNIVQIRTSIIGPENIGGKSLWNWFVECQNESIKGFINQYWNGITTLEWAKWAEKIILEKDILTNSNVLQLGTEKISKYKILKNINEILNLHKNLIPFESDKYVNKCLLSDISLKDISEQIHEAYEFNKK